MKISGWQDKIIALIDDWYQKGYLYWAMWIIIALGAYILFYKLFKALYP